MGTSKARILRPGCGSSCGRPPLNQTPVTVLAQGRWQGRQGSGRALAKLYRLEVNPQASRGIVGLVLSILITALRGSADRDCGNHLIEATLSIDR
jgi:hypothetical protein